MTTVVTQLPAAFLASVALAFGCLIGSFLNVVIYRLPREESVVWPGSHCPHCSTSLHWWENIPLLSWLALKGKCRTCKEPISWRYPVVELTTGLLWMALILREGPTPRFFAEALLVSALVAIFWIDIDTMLILDVMTWPGIALGLVFGWLIAGAWLPHLAAAVGGYASFRFIEWASELALGVPGMGRGDAKLAALMGAWLGPSGLAVALMIAFTLGSVVGLALKARSGGESQPFPFGPSLVVGTLASLFVGGAVWNWYLGLILG